MARQGCRALQRAARVGRATSGLDMSAPVLEGSEDLCLQPHERGPSGQGPQDPPPGRPSTTVSELEVGEDGGVHTSPPRPGRVRLTGYAAVQLLAAIPLLVLFVLMVVGGALVLVWVGIAMLMVTVPLTRWLANGHRRMAARVLGSPVPDPYRPVPPGGPLARLRGVAVDPMTWRGSCGRSASGSCCPCWSCCSCWQWSPP